MANEKILNTRIQLKIATYAEWTDESQELKGANFILKRGEIGLCQIGDTAATGNTEATTNPTVLFKVGDGSTPFKTLKWASALAADVHAWAKKSEAEFKEWAGTNIDTDTDTRYSFVKVDAENDPNYGKLKITAQRYNVKTNSNIGTATVSYVDLVTPEELEEILAGYVESVTTDSEGTITVDNTDTQNPVINFNIADGNNAGNVTLTDTADGLKAEVDLSNFATKAEIPTDFGVISIDTEDDGVVELTPETVTDGAVVITGAHAKKGPNGGYTSSNTTTSVSTGTNSIQIPQLTVDEYGHVTAASDETISINIPAAPVYSIAKDSNSGEYAAIYHLTKDGVNVGTAINIPKDLVVESGTVEELAEGVAGEGKPAGTYIVLTLANANNDKVYVPVDSLIEYVTSGSVATDAVVISISADHKVTATLTDGKITKAKLDSTVQASLDKADGANAYTDAEIKKLDVTVTGMSAGKTIATLTETDGKIAATFQPIAITKSQITDFSDADYAKPGDIGDGKLAITTESGVLTGSVDFTANQKDNANITIGVAAKGITTAKIADKAVTTEKIADHAVGAAQIKAEQGYTGTDAEVWVFDCGGAE